jgi:hypothetical protein
MPLLAMITMSCEAGSLDLFNLKNSRKRRLILFLWTAFPAFLLTVVPSLVAPDWFRHVIMVKRAE